MKKALLATGIAASVFALSACSGNNSASDSEVIVDTSAGNITKEEFYEKLKDAQGEIILSEMITEKVLSEKYKVTDEEVEKRINDMKEQYGEQFQIFLAQYGIQDEDQLRDILRSSLLKEKAATADIEISEKEMKDYYATLKPEIRASHILVDDEKTAKDILAKIEKGEDFAELAKEYSKDPSGKQNGGDLDFFGPGQMVPEFEKAAYALEVGEVSEPVKSQYGWHIIKLTDKKELESFEDMKEEIRQILLQQKIDPQAAQDAIQAEIDAANVKILDEDFEDLFKDEEAEEQTDEQADEPSDESTSDEEKTNDSEEKQEETK